MRISDWSSDVCSSDLADRPAGRRGEGYLHVERCGGAAVGVGLLHRLWPDVIPRRGAEDRTRVVSGKSVSVRVDLGGRRIIKKQNQKPLTWYTTKQQCRQSNTNQATNHITESQI